MKSENLAVMKANGIPVPEFITINMNDHAAVNTDSLRSDHYAVRSSCSIEDSKDYSFAGQFKTCLNVTRQDITDKIEEVRESIRDYKFENCYGKNSERESILNSSEIIIQEMIDSEYSGVIFTSNPRGLLNEIVIVIGNGLGCNVVDDAEDCTTYYYNTTDRLYYRSGNTVNIEDAKLLELIAAADKIKSIFHSDMDIEFAIDEAGRIWILQSREITTLHKDQLITLDSSNISESYPGLVLPLTQEFVHDVYYTAFKNCVQLIVGKDSIVDKLEDSFRTMVEFVNWRAYYRIDNFYSILKLVPFSDKLISIWQESLGVQNKSAGDSNIKVSSIKKLGYLLKLKRLLDKTPKEMDRLNRYFTDRIASYESMAESADTVDQLLEAYGMIKHDLEDKWGITLLNDLYAFIFTHLAHDKSRISNIKSIESMKPVILMNRLITEYNTDSGSPAFHRTFNEYIKLYGDRCIGELKLETKTYRTDPELLYQYIKTHDTTEIAEQNETDLTSIEKKAKLGIANREISRMNRTRIYGIVRTIYLKAGDILVKEGKLADQRDVFYLTAKQFRQSGEEIEKTVAEGKELHHTYDRLPCYTRLEFCTDVFNSDAYDISKGSTDNSIEMIGTPTSAGVITGEAIVIKDADDTIDTRGRIIVTESTDPGWVVLVKNSIGVVAERGSLLSHTAIITRELHKPSVVNIKNAANIIHTGDTIRISGYTGKVEIMKRGAEYADHHQKREQSERL